MGNSRRHPVPRLVTARRPTVECGPMRRLPRFVGVFAVALVVSSVPALSGASSSHFHGVRPSTALRFVPLKGIAVNLDGANRLSDSTAMHVANELFSMLRNNLHANAVSFNFPFWQSSSSSNDPTTAAMTPSPGRLAALTEVAHRYGLSVEYRPYLYEGDLFGQARTIIRPTDPSTWFANYWTFLQPYLQSAGEAGVASFSVAVELPSMMPYLSNWVRIIHESKEVFPGELFYSQQHLPQITIPLTYRGYDAYQPIKAQKPSVAAFTTGFEKNLQVASMQSTAADLTIEELALPAVAGSNSKPNFFHYPSSTKVYRIVQTYWFDGACNAFWSLHMRGLYFWAIDFNTFTPKENDSTSIYNWLGTPSETAVIKCFARSK